MSENQRNVRRRTQTNNVTPYLTSILDNYTRHFNELLANGGVYNGNTLVTPADQLQQYSYSSLANMTPDEILQLGQTNVNPASIYFGINPNSDNFSDGDNFDYERTLRMLLLHTNENGVLTNNVNENGELLYGAIMDLQRNIRLNNRNAIQRQQRNVNNPNTNPPSPTPVVPGSLIDMTLHEYNIMLDELRRHGGVRATNIDDDLEVVLPFDRIITYSQLAHMTPAQILNINGPNTRPEDIIQMITPQDDNFDELAQQNIAFFDDYYTNVHTLLRFTNQQGELTNAPTQWGEGLATAYSDILEAAVNDIEYDDDDEDEDEDEPTLVDEPIDHAPQATLTRQNNRKDEKEDDAMEIHNYAKNINKEELIGFLNAFVNTNPQAAQFLNEGLQYTSSMQDFLDYLKRTLKRFINQYVDEQDRQRYITDLDAIMNGCLQYTNFTRIQYHNISLAEFVVLIFAFVQAQPPNFIDSYVRGFIRETTVSYKKGRVMSCPKGAMERLWTLLGDLAKTFEGQPVFTQNHYMDLYAIINNIFHLNYEQLLDTFTDEWYKQLRVSEDPPSSNNRQINMDYYRNYVLARFNRHLQELFPNPTAEEAGALDDHRAQFAEVVNARIQNPSPELDEMFDYVFKSTTVGGRKQTNKKQTNKRRKIRPNKTSKRRKQKKTKRKQIRSNKTNKRRQTKKQIKKGGFLNTIGFNIGGIDFSKETGKTQYNWKTGKWDPMDCYKVGPIPFCKVKN